MTRASLLCLVALQHLACDRIPGLGKKDGEGTTGGAATAPSGAASAAAPGSKGPMVVVPAGALRAGTPCGGVPRITNEELVGDSIAMTEFSIDVLPYPNEPGKPARVDVTQAEAQALCAAEGKRLCTELEWERACKGPSNATFEYGAAYNAGPCKVAPDLVLDRRPKCVSPFGVKDQHGLVWEWTSSAWGRGTSGDLVAVRGGPGSATVLQARCANGQGRAKDAKAKDVGFRCCSGAPNTAEVSLTLNKQPPMMAEPGVEASLAAAMLKAMPPDHRTVAGAEVAFDRVWRWHPRDNEELLLARWTGKPTDRTKAPWHAIAVFKVCSGVPALIARMHGPVARMEPPGAGADPQKASVAVQTGDDKGEVKLSYWYGAVKVEHPPWVKAGSSLDSDRKRPTLKLPGARVPSKR